MDARPGGPSAKREPSPEGLGLNPKDDLSAVGAALNPAPARPCVIRSKAEGPAVLSPSIHSRPTRNSKLCHPDRSVPGFPASRPSPRATCAAFRKESRLMFANATNLDRKSGGAEWRDLRFLLLFRPRPPLELIRPRTLGKCIGADLRLPPNRILIHRADDPVTHHEAPVNHHRRHLMT
jgi:hypothetical protein